MKMTPIQVTVSMTLTVDRDAWDLTYGSGTDAEAVRKDVRSYFLNQAQNCAAAEEGCITEATVEGA